MQILATLTVRNESPYIQQCLAYHISQGIDVILIDNESTDDSVKLAKPFLGKGLLKIESIPYPGHFDLTAILQKEAEIQRQCQADWLIHLDADEILQSNVPGETLSEAIARVDRKGYEAINFEEFVFLPENGEVDYTGRDYLVEMTHYYCFRPKVRKLVRAFRNGLQASNLESGGHRLQGARVRTYRKRFFLRHYIGLSERHLKQKYGNRQFAPADLAKGWSRNRVGLREDDIELPPMQKLEIYPYSKKRPFSSKKPYRKHFWEWT